MNNRDLYTKEDLFNLIEGKEGSRTIDSGIVCGGKFTYDFFKAPVIYFLEKDGETVYVGQTKRLAARIGEHVNYGKDFDCFYFLHVHEKDMDFLELAFINLIKPKLNSQNTKNIIMKWELGEIALSKYNQKDIETLAAILHRIWSKEILNKA